MCDSVAVGQQEQDIPDTYDHGDNRIYRHRLPKRIAQEGYEGGDEIDSIQSAALDECEYD
jgi:hypothetical protein